MDILVTRSSMPDLDEYKNEIKDMWDTHWLTNMGPKHEQFRKELLSYMAVDNIDLDFFVCEFLQRLLYGFDRTLNVSLDDDIEILNVACCHLGCKCIEAHLG